MLTSHITPPVSRFKQTRWASLVVRNTRSPRSATPLLGLPPAAPTPGAPLRSLVSDGLVWHQISRPARESSAHTWSGPETYITPSLTTGVVCNSEEGNE